LTIICGVFVLGAGMARAADPDLCSALQPSACLNGVSSSVTSFAALRVTSLVADDRREAEKKKKQAALAPFHVAAAPGASGLLGQDAGGWGVWAGYSRASFEGRVAVAPYDAKLDSVRLGADRLFSNRYVLGAALVVDRLDTTTRFNGGGQDVDSTTLAPYFTILVTDRVSVDFNAGYGRMRAKQNRIDPASAPGAPNILTASYDGDRYFGSVTGNYMQSHGDWVFGSRAGYLYSRENQDAYTETGGPSARSVLKRNLKLGQVFLGADAGYRAGGNVELYGVGLYRRDVQRNDGSSAGGLPNAVGSTQPDDRTEWEWALGLRFFAARGATFAAEFVKTTGRDRFGHHAVNLLLRFDL
jgi:hypothetical protein